MNEDLKGGEKTGINKNTRRRSSPHIGVSIKGSWVNGINKNGWKRNIFTHPMSKISPNL